ncbi:hypothetical protein PF011_g11171 [Phytophthora fragariae]|uniref:Uncharacterized protein n=1 Tax=Phytophthora fragariae TaxID=53985 RepID=A0A6A3KJ21_9STRA|nr:hypothetical protein PF011_g11171 [Phytophthora fragariae]
MEAPPPVMSPSDNGDSSRPSAPGPVPASEVQLSAAQDPFAPFEEARSHMSASDANERGNRVSASSERLDRLEGLLEGMGRQIADQQLQMQAQVREVAQVQRPLRHVPRGFATSTEFSAGEGIFGDNMWRQDQELDRRMRPASLEEPVDHGGGRAAGGTGAAASADAAAAAWAEAISSDGTNAAGACAALLPATAVAAAAPADHAEAKGPGLKFLTRLRAAQAMSRGNWTKDFRIMAFSGKLEGPALAFYDKMQSMWMAESGTGTHMLDRMLGFYSTKTPVTKAMELMSEPKPADKTWTEHFQYLVYVAEKSGFPDPFVLQASSHA